MKTKKSIQSAHEKATMRTKQLLTRAMWPILFLVLATMVAEAQITIRGKVTDLQKNPIAGVNINEKGKSNGTLTNVGGDYSIVVASENSVLVFSFIGMEKVERKVGKLREITVTLKPTPLELREVVTVKTSGKKKDEVVNEVFIVADVACEYDALSAPMFISQQVMEQNQEDYAAVRESGFKWVNTDPLSTFSIDVDNAAYSNVRRFINLGQCPPKDAVRIEEMINYFSYTYRQPAGNHPFHVETEYTQCPWNGKRNLLLVGLQGKDIAKENLPPSNLVFLIDVSGSMESPNKLPLVKSALRLLVDELRPQDKVAIVVYAGAAGLVLEPTPGSKKSDIVAAIDRLSAGGSTAGGEGIKLAYKIARQNFQKNGNNRIILATDGDFNVGVSSNSEMERLVEQERNNGVFLTVLGFGMGNYKDSKLETIADKGNGNYAYIDNIQEARKVFISEFGGTLFTIAKDVKFQLEFNPKKVKAYRLIGYENRALANEDFNNDKKDAGELGAGHRVTALYEIIPAGSDEELPGVDKLKYQTSRGRVANGYSNELLTVKLRYKQPDADQSILFENAVKDDIVPLAKTSDNIRFAASVAQFGMLLRDSEHKGTSSLETTLALAKGSKGNDEEGYRSEFIRLVDAVRSADLLSKR